MSKRILIIASALVVVIVGAILVSFVSRQSEAPSAEGTRVASGAPAPASPSPGPAVPSAGTYVEYSGSAVGEAEGTTLLFFHAPWCPQCNALEDDILSMGVPAGISIIKVDYDSHQDLRQQYGVTLQTTFVEIDSSGKGVQSYVAYEDPRLQAVLDAML